MEDKEKNSSGEGELSPRPAQVSGFIECRSSDVRTEEEWTRIDTHNFRLSKANEGAGEYPPESRFAWDFIELTGEEIEQMCDAVDGGHVSLADEIVDGAEARLLGGIT